MTDETKFLLTGDDLATSFMQVVGNTDPLLLRAIYSNTILLFLSKQEGDAENMTAEEFENVLVDTANDAFDLIVDELESVRDAKIALARGDFVTALL
jgi:hypothetical protein